MNGLAVAHGAAYGRQGICRVGGPLSLHRTSCCSFGWIRDLCVHAEKKELSSKEEHGVAMVPMHAIVDSKSSVTYPRPIKAVGTTEKVLTVGFEMFKLTVPRYLHISRENDTQSASTGYVRVQELAQYVSI